MKGQQLPVFKIFATIGSVVLILLWNRGEKPMQIPENVAFWTAGQNPRAVLPATAVRMLNDGSRRIEVVLLRECKTTLRPLITTTVVVERVGVKFPRYRVKGWKSGGDQFPYVQRFESPLGALQDAYKLLHLWAFETLPEGKGRWVLPKV
jgi:hypothetical protein